MEALTCAPPTQAGIYCTDAVPQKVADCEGAEWDPINPKRCTVGMRWRVGLARLATCCPSRAPCCQLAINFTRCRAGARHFAGCGSGRRVRVWLLLEGGSLPMQRHTVRHVLLRPCSACCASAHAVAARPRLLQYGDRELATAYYIGELKKKLDSFDGKDSVMSLAAFGTLDSINATLAFAKAATMKAFFLQELIMVRGGAGRSARGTNGRRAGSRAAAAAGQQAACEVPRALLLHLTPTRATPWFTPCSWATALAALKRWSRLQSRRWIGCKRGAGAAAAPSTRRATLPHVVHPACTQSCRPTSMCPRQAELPPQPGSAGRPGL